MGRKGVGVKWGFWPARCTLGRVPPATPLREVMALFFKLGVIGFGGPAAHIALMREEVVKRRKWVSDERFLDLLGMTNLIPGPNSTEMAIHLGYTRAGWPGLVAGGACFVVPAMVIVWALAWAYVRYGAQPQVGWLLYGVKPVIIAVVVQAIWALLRTAVKGTLLAAVALAVLALSLMGVNEIALLAAGGLVVPVARGVRGRAGYDGGGVREPHDAVCHLPQDRLRPLRQRLRSPRVPPQRLRPPSRLAHRSPAPRCHRDRSGHARPRAHDRHLRRLPRRRRRRGGPRDRRHFPAVIRVRRGEPPAPAEDPRVALDGGVPRRRQRRRPRPDGGGDVGARARGRRRLADRAAGPRGRGRAHPIRGQLGVAHPRGRRRRPPLSPHRRLSASCICGAPPTTLRSRAPT